MSGFTARTRLIFFSLILMSLSPIPALPQAHSASDDVSGTWGSTLEEMGYVQESVPNPGPYTYHYDALLELDQAGSSVTGTLEITGSNVVCNMPGTGWEQDLGNVIANFVGSSYTYTVSGTVSDSTLTISLDDITFTLTHTVNPGDDSERLQGTGRWLGDAGETNEGTYDLRLLSRATSSGDAPGSSDNPLTSLINVVGGPMLDIITTLGGLTGATGTNAIVYGAIILSTAVAFTAGMVVYSVSRARRRAKGPYRHEFRIEPGYQEPQPPTASHDVLASTIDVPPRPESPPKGVGFDSQPPRLQLRASWSGGRVVLEWDAPRFDPSEYELEGYEVVRLQYDGRGSEASKNPMARLPPERERWEWSFEQTYRWNTAGDVEGYTVNALFCRLPGLEQGMRIVGDTVYAPSR